MATASLSEGAEGQGGGRARAKSAVHRPAVWRPRQSAASSRCVRRARVDAWHDGHGANLGLNDMTVEALALTSGDPAGLRSYWRFITIFRTWCWHRAPSVRGDPTSTRDQHGYADTPPTPRLGCPHHPLQGAGRKRRRAFPQTRTASCGAPSGPCSALTTSAPSPIAAPRHPGKSRGTAVNVQRWCSATWADSATGCPFTRTDRRATALRRILVNAQGEDVVAGIRTPQEITEIAVGSRPASPRLDAMPAACRADPHHGLC